jgi:hypothetical protein
MFTPPHTRSKADRPARHRLATRHGVHRLLGALVISQAVGSVYKVAHSPHFVQPWNRRFAALSAFQANRRLSAGECRTPVRRMKKAVHSFLPPAVIRFFYKNSRHTTIRTASV